MYGPVKVPVRKAVIDGRTIGASPCSPTPGTGERTCAQPCVHFQVRLYRVNVTDVGGVSVDYRMDNHESLRQEHRL